MKKLLITALAGIAIGFSAYADEQAWVNGIRYSFSARQYGTTEKFECSTYKPSDAGFPSGDEYTGDIVIPEEVEYQGKTYVVTAIGYQSFYDQSGVTSVTAPSTIEKIDTQALSGTAITSFIIPENVQSLNLYPFMSCRNLTELISLNPTPPTTVASTFQGVKQQTVKLYVPKGCVDVYKNATRWSGFTQIEEYADSPIRPTSVTITKHPNVMIVGTTYQLECVVEPEDVTDNSVTWKSLDTNIVTVTDDGLLTAVGAGRTYVEAICNGDKTVSVNFNITVINEQATIDGMKYRFVLDEANRIANAYVIRDASYAGDIVIPQTVQNGSTFIVRGIDQNSFALNNNVTSVTFPSTINTVGFNAFRNCTGLQTVNISDLGAWAQIDFSDKLATPLNITGVKFLVNGQEIKNLNIDGSVETVKQFTFSGVNSLESVKFSEGVRTIAKSAFDRCPYLANVEFSASVDSIGLSAFANCASLENVNLPAGLRNISAGAFSGCALKTLVVPDNVSVIDNQAFMNNTYLKEITLPASLKMLYLQVFAGCPSIETVTVNATTPPTFFSASSSIPLNDFNREIYTTANLYVPEESLAAYKAAYGWKQFKNILAITVEQPTIEAVIDNITYELNPNEKTATVKTGTPVNSTVTIPDEVTYEQTIYPVTAVADSAFFNLKEVVNLTIGSNVATIGRYAFAGTGIDMVAIPQKVRNLSQGTFADCASLISVSLPDELQSIGVKAFYGSPRIRYIFCNNMGGESLTPPVFDTYEGDPTNYGEAFSTEIWPDCQLVIPANMFANYKRCNGWKNFRSWVYWHDYDILPTAITLTPSELTGEVGQTLQIVPGLEPSGALLTNFIITGLDTEMISLTSGKNNEGVSVYEIDLLKEGTTSFTVYCGLNKKTCDITINKGTGVTGIESESDGAVRYYNMQGVEIENPTAGQTVIEIRGGKSTKKIIR